MATYLGHVYGLGLSLVVREWAWHGCFPVRLVINEHLTSHNVPHNPTKHLWRNIRYSCQKFLDTEPQEAKISYNMNTFVGA